MFIYLNINADMYLEKQGMITQYLSKFLFVFNDERKVSSMRIFLAFFSLINTLSKRYYEGVKLIFELIFNDEYIEDQLNEK